MRYDPSATYIPHRRYMVDWISEIGEELKLQPVTIHSAISFLDQVCTTQGYDPKGWRLQAICCLSVAAKYEEAERNMPMVSEMAIAAETRLTTGMVTQGELSLARGLGWDISRVTAMHFLGYYLHQGVTFLSDECQGRALVTKVTRYMKKYVEFFANLCQQDYSFQRHRPSTIAAASILAARRALCIAPLWRPELERLTGCAPRDIQACAEEVWAFYEAMFPTHQPLRTSGSEPKPTAGAAL
ncbi:cyclin-like protein [Tribonema minus]|uniref:Cyclin-like protein n=1 Tax=Tribonema minus TaxID=303371 RepID=A0A835ZBR6_9STRA|nr:cyclin-like protein [Tribonema minus]